MSARKSRPRHSQFRLTFLGATGTVTGSRYLVEAGGRRILVDRLLGGRRPAGYGVQTKSHNAVAAAIAQHRADWGVAIATVARQYGLAFIPLQEERYDFVVPAARLERAPVKAFCALLEDREVRRELAALGFLVD